MVWMINLYQINNLFDCIDNYLLLFALETDIATFFSPVPLSS